MTNFSELTDSQWAAISPFFNLKRNATMFYFRLIMPCVFYRTPFYLAAVNYYFEQWKVEWKD